MSGNTKIELFDLWFSYSGKDKDFTQTLSEELGLSDNNSELSVDLSKQEDAIQRLVSRRSGLSAEVKNVLESCRFLINRYVWENKKDNHGAVQEYRLLNGMDIGELLFDICNSLIKIVILNENYFKSPVCMQEFCLCLCSYKTQHDIWPFIIVKSNRDFDELITQTFEFSVLVQQQLQSDNADQENVNQENVNQENVNQENVNQENVNQENVAQENVAQENVDQHYGSYKTESLTLAEALLRTYEGLRKTYPNGVRGVDFSTKTQKNFQDKLKKLGSKTRLQANGLKESEIAEETIEFAAKVVAKVPDTDPLDFVDTKFEEVIAQPTAMRLLKFIKFEDSDSARTAFFKIDSAKKAQEFLVALKKSLAADTSVIQSPTTQTYISELCSLVILKTMQSYQVAALRKSQQSKGLLSVFAADTSITNVKHLMNARLAIAIAEGSTINFELTAPKIEEDIGAKFRGMISPGLRMEGTNACPEDKTYTLFQNLVTHYQKHRINRMPKTLSELEMDKVFLSSLRHDIEYKNLDGDDAFIVVRADQDRTEFGYYKSVSEMLRILNRYCDEDDNIQFPIVELKVPFGIKGEEVSTLLPEDTYEKVRRCLRGIFDLFHKEQRTE